MTDAADENNAMDEKDIQFIADEITTLQETMLTHLEEVQKTIASRISPLIFGSLIGLAFFGGVILSLNNNILNVLVLMLALLVGISLFIIRHYYVSRPIDSVREFFTTGTPFAEDKTLPFIDKVLSFPTSSEIYNMCLELLDDESLEFYPLFEQYLEESYKTATEDE